MKSERRRSLVHPSDSFRPLADILLALSPPQTSWRRACTSERPGPCRGAGPFFFRYAFEQMVGSRLTGTMLVKEMPNPVLVMMF